MATQKVQFLFSAGKNGWSETYYCQSSDLTTGFNAALALARKRWTLLASPAAIDYIRVSDAENPRRSTITGIGGGTAYPMSYEAYATESDTPWQAQLVSLSNNAADLQRQLYVRGNADGVFDRGDPANADATLWTQKFTTQFKPEITSGTWFIKKRQRNITGVTRFNIANISPNGTDATQTDLLFDTTAPTTQPGDFIVVYRIKGLRPAMGLVRVIGDGATNLTKRVFFTLPASFNYTGGAYAIQYVVSYEAIAYCNWQRTTERKTGRPFGVTRGRRVAVPR